MVSNKRLFPPLSSLGEIAVGTVFRHRLQPGSPSLRTTLLLFRNDYEAKSVALGLLMNAGRYFVRLGGSPTSLL